MGRSRPLRQEGTSNILLRIGRYPRLHPLSCTTVATRKGGQEYFSKALSRISAKRIHQTYLGHDLFLGVEKGPILWNLIIAVAE